MGLFHADIKEFLDNSTAQTITTFISSHRKAIANSVKKSTAASQAGVTSVVQWIRRWSNNEDIIEKMHAARSGWTLFDIGNISLGRTDALSAHRLF
jgi:hypothetical protein